MKILYGIAEDIGFRPSMEDAHAICEREEEDLFSAEVYDGHAGSMAAHLAAEMLTPEFLSLVRTERDKPPKTRNPDRELLREAYLAADRYVVGRATDSGRATASSRLDEGLAAWVWRLSRSGSSQAPWRDFRSARAAAVTVSAARRDPAGMARATACVRHGPLCLRPVLWHPLKPAPRCAVATLVED